MVAYHFPPLAGSSGIQRTLRFVQHLPSLGWEPLVLSAAPRAYEQTSDDLMGDVPPGTVVRRAFALDTARHLNLGGRYIGWMARPDRWVSWKFAGIAAGRGLIRKFRPDAIWSTYPIATAHLIAGALHRHSGIPWVADFRDPMAQRGYPADPRTRDQFLRIEADAAQHARFCTFTTHSAARDYRERYPAAADRMTVLENGYDEESFQAAAAMRMPQQQQAAGGPLVLLHSGIVYPSERDPRRLLEALRRLRDAGLVKHGDVLVRFRAAVHDRLLADMATEWGVIDLIELAPAIPYRAALAEMMSVDALLIMQASNCNAQIPAKIYEYLRAGRPIVGLTDPAGDTAAVLRAAGVDAMARLDSAEEIERMLAGFLVRLRDGSTSLPTAAVVDAASRRGRSQALAAMLEQAASGASP